ncbi:MAG: DNA-directed RNA polymerase subunit alpha C-terminal domain-containing protein [Candidatus Limivicinus sp.]|nr:DNA-directed RNA polymerase subunit alpha C-terminal domain-containing protein [Candidatus Limivicinus sp.]
MDIDEINFSVRAMNALRRAKIFTLGDVIKALSAEDLIKIRNLGKKSLNEIKSKMLSFGFAQLSPSAQQAFFEDLVVRNQRVNY